MYIVRTTGNEKGCSISINLLCDNSNYLSSFLMLQDQRLSVNITANSSLPGVPRAIKPLTFIIRYRIIYFRMNDHDTPLIVPALERATHAVALWIDHALGDLRLAQAEAHVLAYLAQHSPCSINDLHHSFGHKRSTLTSLLDRLDERGWIIREAHPTSRRMVQVRLTGAGRQVADQVGAALRDLEERVLAHAGWEDVHAFLRVLHTLEEELSHEPHNR
jgi:DNA-binding MarR family transcriptional regulator